MLDVMTGIHKMLVKTANSEEPDQTASSEAVLKKQSDLGLHCLSRPFDGQLAFRNFRTFAVTQNSSLVIE